MINRKSNIFYFVGLVVFCFLPVQLWGQETVKKAIAEKGDGVYSLLRKNGLDPGAYSASFIELNKDALKENNVLIEGAAYILPSVAASAEKPAAEPASGPEFVDYPLFGKKYSRVVVKDDKLKGAVYYLMAGHGGPDPGAVTKYGAYTISEDEYAYDVTLRLARRLIEHGATVYMIIRDEDDGIRDEPILVMDSDELNYPAEAIHRNHRLRLKQRTDAVNKLYIKHKGAYQRLLAIHVDSRSEGENIDVFFYHHHRSKSGERLANYIHQSFLKNYAAHQPGRNYYGDVSDRSGLYVVKNTHPPTAFIELGNIKNVRDQRRFVLYNNRQALANWIAEGIIADYQNNK